MCNFSFLAFRFLQYLAHCGSINIRRGQGRVQIDKDIWLFHLLVWCCRHKYDQKRDSLVVRGEQEYYVQATAADSMNDTYCTYTIIYLVTSAKEITKRERPNKNNSCVLICTQKRSRERERERNSHFFLFCINGKKFQIKTLCWTWKRIHSNWIDWIGLCV